MGEKDINIGKTLTFDDILLVPQYSEIKSRKDVDIRTDISKKNKFLLDVPFISSGMDTVTESAMAITIAQHGGIGVIHRFITIDNQVAEIKKVKELKLKVAGAIGVKDGEIDRAKALIEAGADMIVLDIAHGHSKNAIDFIKKFRENFPNVFLLAGNVATGKGFYDLAKAGADAIKVGIGSGSICITRMTTGFGVPQVSAVMDCVKAAEELGVGLISDGGIRHSGDVVKALAIGADAVMMGNVLAGTDQTPGKLINFGDKQFKVYRGMASIEANIKRTDKNSEVKDIIPEGVSGLVPYKGDVSQIIGQFIGGVRSGLSYGGAFNLKELREKTEIIQITQAGIRESGFHDIYLSGENNNF